MKDDDIRYSQSITLTRSRKCVNCSGGSEVFSYYDVTLTPTAALPWQAQEIFPEEIDGQKVGGRDHAVVTGIVNVSGCAGINVPCGLSFEGLPIGLQFVARLIQMGC